MTGGGTGGSDLDTSENEDSGEEEEEGGCLTATRADMALEATVSTSRLSTLTFLNFLKIFLSTVNIFLHSKYFCLHISFHVVSPAPGRRGTMINTIWQLACRNAGPRRIKFYIAS